MHKGRKYNDDSIIDFLFLLAYVKEMLINAPLLRGIAINLLYSFSSGVSWQGHIGGGIAGLAAALVLCKGNGRYE